MARDGDTDALSALLMSLRNYLRRLARVQHDKDLRKKISTDDVLQEAYMQAIGDFADFKGENIGELIGWLRAILKTKRAKAARQYLTKKRDMTLEQELDVGLEQSAQAMASLARSDGTQPADHILQQEAALQLSDALDQLPKSQRKVVELHHLEDLTFQDVGEQMERSPDAVQKLWQRALISLGKILKVDS